MVLQKPMTLKSNPGLRKKKQGKMSYTFENAIMKRATLYTNLIKINKQIQTVAGRWLSQ